MSYPFFSHGSKALVGLGLLFKVPWSHSIWHTTLCTTL